MSTQFDFNFTSQILGIFVFLVILGKQLYFERKVRIETLITLGTLAAALPVGVLLLLGGFNESYLVKLEEYSFQITMCGLVTIYFICSSIWKELDLN